MTCEKPTVERYVDLLIHRALFDETTILLEDGKTLASGNRISGYNFTPHSFIVSAISAIECYPEYLIRKRICGNDYRVWVQTNTGSEHIAHGETKQKAIVNAIVKAENLDAAIEEFMFGTSQRDLPHPGRVSD